MTVLSNPYPTSASASRPVSAFCASDEEEEDPWAIKPDTTAMASDPRQPVETVRYSIPEDKDDQESHTSAGYNTAYSPPPPALSDDEGVGPGGIARKSRGSQEDTRHRRPNSSSLQQAVATPSFPPNTNTKHTKNSSLDPWASTSHSTSGWSAPRTSPTPGVPPTTSSIRGGFAGSSYDNADEEEEDTHRLPPLPRSPPGPSSYVAVELRPDIEGLIFKYNSYNVIRRPISTGDEADDLSSSSARLLNATRLSRQQSSRSRDSNYTPLPSSFTSGSNSTVSSTVVRRYSDFVWLNDVLLRRYPFRLIPVLPPKRLSIPVAGRNLSDGFIEKRRRGLQRYLRAIISHPVLAADDIVQVFLSEKQSISDYKQSHSNISLNEETTPPSAVHVSVPRDLSTKLDLTSTQMPVMVDKWTTLCTLFERIAKRIESQGGDHGRIGSLIDAISQGGGMGGRAASPISSSSSSSIAPCSNVVAPTATLASSLHRDFSDLCTVRSRSLTLHALEGLKNQRDLWLAWRDLLSRHSSLSGDSVPALKAQVASTRARLNQLSAVPPAQRPPTYHADVAKVEEQLRIDSLQIEALLKRRERIRLAMWEELGVLAARKEQVASVWREWCKEELLGRAAQKRAVEECWSKMSGPAGPGGR